MSIDLGTLRAHVAADLPWHTEPSLRGTLHLSDDALVLDRSGPRGGRVAIPLTSIARASLETTFGVLPALHVWHTLEGQEVRSRFEFGVEDDEQVSGESGLADRIGPGIAREAAERLEGGLRALTGGLNLGMRTARQAVDGLARQDEYKIWPAAIAQAQAAAKRSPASPSRSTPAREAPPTPIVPAGAAAPVGDAATTFTWFREQALAWLQSCGARARELGVRGAPVIQREYPLDSPVCRIVVAGEFSRGKSTVINALFGIHGEIALPTGMTPTTPLACAIRVPRVGESDGATISYRSARPARELTLEQFRTSVRLVEQGGEMQEGDVAPVDLHLDEARRVEVRITGAYLPAGVEIEDTPGLNEQAGRSAGAHAALGRADLILFVLAADQLLGDLERDVIEHTLIAGHHRNVLFLVNFWDTIDDETQRATLRQRVETQLTPFPTPFTGSSAAEVGSLPHVYYISALQAARAQRQHRATPEASGITGLRARLRDLLGPGSQALLLRARLGRALRYTHLLREAVSRAAAATSETTERRTARQSADRYEEALAAALRTLDGLAGAVDGATARPLMKLRQAGTPGLHGLLTTGDPLSSPESRRAFGAELRAATAEVALAAQQAVDLIVAQVRAAFLARGLPAPVLETHLETPATFAPTWEASEHPIVHCEQAADSIEAETRKRIGGLHATLAAELRAHAAVTASPPPPSPAADSAEVRQRRAALHMLEEDLIRLEKLLAPLLLQ